MQRLTLASGIPDDLKGSIVALGNFDGFHLGHRRWSGGRSSAAFTSAGPSIVATFDPHPVRLFKPELPPFRLTSLDQREAFFTHAGADAMLVFGFGGTRLHRREDFVEPLVLGSIGAGGSGHRRRLHLRQGPRRQWQRWPSLPPRHGVIAEAVQPVLAGDDRVSSGRIRDALIEGDMATATKLLTRPYAIAGVVEAGDKRGRDLGFPTANVSLGDYQRPLYGVYAVRVRLEDGSEHDGVANVGIRPMFDPPQELLGGAYLRFR